MYCNPDKSQSLPVLVTCDFKISFSDQAKPISIKMTDRSKNIKQNTS